MGSSYVIEISQDHDIEHIARGRCNRAEQLQHTRGSRSCDCLKFTRPPIENEQPIDRDLSNENLILRC